MSDDFGTVNISRSERAREIEVMRQHLRRHRESLVSMAEDAPTEHLAAQYRRLARDIDISLQKLDELEGTAAPVPPLSRPLAGSPATGEDIGVSDLPPAEGEPRSRVALIIVVALVALALIGWLIWRASSDRTPEGGTIVEPTLTSETAPAPADIQPPPVVQQLAVSPPASNYGVIRKGTRATRQFEVSNSSEEPISIVIARSTCRCLFYEHAEVVPPKGKESITVTVDGARAEAGELRETIRVTSKSNPSVGTSFDVIATVR